MLESSAPAAGAALRRIFPRNRWRHPILDLNRQVPEDLLGVGTGPYIVIHMGPQSLKGWVPEKWVLLAATLKERGYDLVATGGAGSEMEVARDWPRRYRCETCPVDFHGGNSLQLWLTLPQS